MVCTRIFQPSSPFLSHPSLGRLGWWIDTRLLLFATIYFRHVIAPLKFMGGEDKAHPTTLTGYHVTG